MFEILYQKEKKNPLKHNFNTILQKTDILKKSLVHTQHKTLDIVSNP